MKTATVGLVLIMSVSVISAQPRIEVPLTVTDGENTDVVHYGIYAGATTIGVAGTVTTLAALGQGLKDFQLEKIANHRLTRSAVDMLLQKLQTMKAKHILALSSTAAGREDILTAGTLILYMFMKHAGVERIMVSERGVRYGLALREWRR